jgi:hypothetical protein
MLQSRAPTAFCDTRVAFLKKHLCLPLSMFVKICVILWVQCARSLLKICGCVIKKYGVADFSNVLGDLEVEKLHMFSGYKLASNMRCWEVLIPQKMLGGYEEAIATLEQMVMKPKMIKPCCSPPAAPDARVDPRAELVRVSATF